MAIVCSAGADYSVCTTTWVRSKVPVRFRTRIPWLPTESMGVDKTAELPEFGTAIVPMELPSTSISASALEVALLAVRPIENTPWFETSTEKPDHLWSCIRVLLPSDHNQAGGTLALDAVSVPGIGVP